MQRKLAVAGASAAAVALIAGATGYYAVAEGKEDRAAPSSASSASSVSLTGGSAVTVAESGISAADAIDAALAHTSGSATAADLESEGGRVYWQVDIVPDGTGATLWTVHVDPADGDVLAAYTEKDAEDAAQARTALSGASTTAREAADAAAAKGRVTSVDLAADGTPSWSVETASGAGQRDWRVDLTTGTVAAEPADD
ncbi:peptidase propeptide and YpeB domain protein [Streptomyces sp. SID8379]|uniref:PepSY domain-containing protein n=1 Tax=unclassified Streptomyces TaxID=2593676 RepID=UPI000374CEA5|nr:MULTISPECIES: PepSY domain-containing protein [unclassified Streptomyces]MYW67250.1 peptidase propeptide and YpeB domain protein [Streptomyces sp. SID8379]